MDNAYAMMLAVFFLGVAVGAVFQRSWWSVAIPMLLPIAVTIIPILQDPKSGEAFLFVAPFLLAIALMYGVISFIGVAAGRSFRQRKAQTSNVTAADPDERR